MALIVETGAVVAGAESYISVADCTSYHSNRNNVLWTGADAVKEAALRKATSYIDNKYLTRWLGYRKDKDQSLRWPRGGVPVTDSALGSLTYLDNTTIPQCLKDATCEAALRFLSAELAPDLKRGGRVSSVNVGGIQQSFEQGASPNTLYQIIDQLLAPLLSSGSGMSLVRG